MIAIKFIILLYLNIWHLDIIVLVVNNIKSTSGTYRLRSDGEKKIKKNFYLCLSGNKPLYPRPNSKPNNNSDPPYCFQTAINMRQIKILFF